MRVSYVITKKDIGLIRKIVEDNKNDDFVQRRIARNVRGDRPSITPSHCWHVHMMCLLTTQQRSGPNSRVARLLAEKPFRLRLGRLKRSSDAQKEISRVLKNFGGIRRTESIAKQAKANLD